MKRREAIRNILLASASTIFITGCSEANVIDFLKEGNLQLNSNHEDYLSKISESFLPLSSLEGKVGKPVDFILKMLNDCHSSEQVQQYAEGFEQYKTLMNQSKLKIKSSSPNEIIPVVQKILEETEQPQEALIFFINKTKGLSIQNLTSSEYYMTEHLDYQLIPKAPYDGCTPI